eukprot:scaffold32285_cov130-Isochrysis_galbana.AAC.4
MGVGVLAKLGRGGALERAGAKTRGFSGSLWSSVEVEEQVAGMGGMGIGLAGTLVASRGAHRANTHA